MNDFIMYLIAVLAGLGVLLFLPLYLVYRHKWKRSESNLSAITILKNTLSRENKELSNNLKRLTTDYEQLLTNYKELNNHLHTVTVKSPPRREGRSDKQYFGDCLLTISNELREASALSVEGEAVTLIFFRTK